MTTPRQTTFNAAAFRTRLALTQQLLAEQQATGRSLDALVTEQALAGTPGAASLRARMQAQRP